MIEEAVWNCEKALLSGSGMGEPASSTLGVDTGSEVNVLFQEKSKASS